MGSFSIWHVLIVLVIIGLFYPFYRFCLSYKLLLIALGEKYQAFSPNMAYLMFIPVVGLIWWLYMAYHIKSSLNDQKEILTLKPSDDGGFLYSVITVTSSFLSFVPLVGIVAFIFWILSWIKVVNTRKMITVNQMA